MTDQASVDDLITQAMQLSRADRARIIERLARSLIADTTPKRKPYGIIQADVSEEDIAEARAEMWKNFPREDV